MLRKPALLELQFRSHHDHRPSRVIHPLSQEILAEAALFALQQIAQRLQRTVAVSLDRSRAPSVVEQRIHRLLQHPLFVPQDHLGGLDIHQFLQPIVPIDHPPIQIVQIRRGETSALQGHQRSQLRRNDRDHIHNHPFRTIPRLSKGFHHPQSLQHLLFPLDGSLHTHPGPQLRGQLLDVDLR